MEQYLKEILASLKKAQDEILYPCQLYTQLEDIQFMIEEIIELKSWDGKI